MNKTLSRQEMEQAAAIMVRNARADLILQRKFYAVLVAQTEPKPCWTIDTMATDSVTHYYNPAFILSQGPSRVLGTQAHETEHDARHHSTRRKGRDARLWNEACDYAINPDLIAEGFTLPEGVLVRADLAGLSAEEIYRVLVLEQQQRPQQQQPQQGQQGESDDDENEGDSGSQHNTGASQEAEDEAAGDERASDSDDSDSDSGLPDSSGKPRRGISAGAGGTDDAGTGDSDKAGPVSCGAGGCGEVLDAPGNEAEQADLDAKWEVLARQAVSIARKAGQLPGHWAEEIERRHTPTQDWKSILREYIDANSARIQTWNRPNRRFIGRGLTLPGYQKDGVNKVAFIIDASDSMSGQHLKVANELQAALDDGAISEVILIYCDVDVYHVDRFADGDRITFFTIRRGGTDMRPAFRWIDENDSDASLIVCLTDLEIGNPGDEPACPVLWAAYGDPRLIKQYGAQMPWGRVIDVDVE